VGRDLGSTAPTARAQPPERSTVARPQHSSAFPLLHHVGGSELLWAEDFIFVPARVLSQLTFYLQLGPNPHAWVGQHPGTV